MNKEKQTINHAYHILLRYGINITNINEREILESLDKIIEYNNKIIIQKRENIKQLLQEL